MIPKEPLSGVRLTSENPGSILVAGRHSVSAPLTPRQVQVVECVERFIAAHGYPPTIRELGAMVGMTSTSAIVAHLKRIEAKGYLERDRHEARGIRVLVSVDGASVIGPRPLAKATGPARMKAVGER